MYTRFRTSIKGKAFAIFLISLAAIVSAYLVNRHSFGEIRSSVAGLSHTNKKLVLVNDIFTEVNESEKTFRHLLVSDNVLDTFRRQSRRLQASATALRSLSADNVYQSLLLDSIRLLIETREKSLLDYAGFRRQHLANNPLKEQTRILDSLIAIENASIDSVVYSREQRNSTTHIDSVLLPETEEKRGLWQKIFGAKKKDPQQLNTVVQYDEKQTIDTIVRIVRNRVAEEAQLVIEEIEREQRERRQVFMRREALLNNFENAFHRQITRLLSAVEKDINQKTTLAYHQADKSIGRSMGRVFVIIAIFALALLVLLLLMMGDVTRSNRYRRLLETARADAEAQSASWHRFLSNMSHEIRTPLQSIIGYSEQAVADPGAAGPYVTVIHNASEHLLGVINEILDYNRIVSGKFSFEAVSFDMQQVIRETTAILRQLAVQKSLDFHVDDAVPGDAAYVTGDPQRLRQILLNLGGNAIKFTASGHVRLHIAAQTGAQQEQVIYTFCIADTGPGIPAERQEQIFGRFEKGTWSDGAAYQGSGLGLSIVKALVDGQDGTITLESEPGKGACFCFSLPYQKAAAVPARPQLPAGARNGVVWMVDDDPLILRLCRHIFEKHGIACRCFEQATALLEALTVATPELVLADIRMPGMDGLALYTALRRTLPDTIPVVAVTAQALPGERQEILQHGFTDILLKPFRESELVAMLHLLLPGDMPATSAAQEQSLEEEILQCYREETAGDLARLRAALHGNNASEATLMLHRMAGRTAQIGNRKLGYALRQLELRMRQHGPVTYPEVEAVAEQLEMFMQAQLATQAEQA